MTSELKLLPCPFCGGEAYTRAYNDTFWVRCERCGVETQDLHLTRPQAAEEWNRRAPARSDAVARLVEACKATLRAWRPCDDMRCECSSCEQYAELAEILAAVEKEMQ